MSIVATKIFDRHPSTINIKKRKFESIFNPKNTSKLKIEKVLNNLNILETCENADTPTKVI